ncbi:helix-turn-helix transcriptional regulator [Citromicrobium bathyomarinum]|uniref:helix-turn-helix domain-containing protein n=1 Tax=Sphingomonadales TaxID=204457 RepID=UPI00315A6BBC
MTAATPSNSCLKGHGFVIYDASHNYNEPVNLVLQRSIWWGKALKNGPLKAAMSRKSDVKYSTGDECDIKATAPASSSCTKEAHAVDPMLASMQPAELKLAMDELGYSTQTALARAIGVDRSTVSLWLDGRIGVPRPIAKLVRLLILHHGPTEREST